MGGVAHHGSSRPDRRAACALALLVCALGGCAPAGGNAAEPAGGTCRSAAVGSPGGVIEWVDAARPGDAGALARWCATVGPPVVTNVPAAAPPGDSLVIVSWNVHVGGGDVARLVADLRAGHLTGGRGVSSFVLLLQEAYRGG